MGPKKVAGISKPSRNQKEPANINQNQQFNGFPSNSLVAEEEEYKQPIKRTVKPHNQLNLTEVQLEEEHTRVLTANDPNIPNNIIRYNYKEKAYKQDPEGPMDHLAIHVDLVGCLMHKDSAEATTQAEYRENKRLETERLRREAAAEAAEAGEEDIMADAPKTGKNQFNYSERAAQTFNNPVRNRSVSTEPPPIGNFKATATQWDIYDAYMQDMKSSQEDEKSKDKSDSNQSAKSKEIDMVHSIHMASALKILERMINQNSQDEIFQDFKYWDDLSDNFRQNEGSLLPLWRFSIERTKRKQVTAMSWNPRHNDLFAVAYGSYDFLRQSSGILCIYTLKNINHPEYMFVIDSGIMCLDFHPVYPSLLAIGCYDGNVYVYDIRLKGSAPIYSSSIKTGKHTDPVWQVSWQIDDMSKELNFFSISSDGLVASWILSKNELKMEPIMQLKLSSSSTSSVSSNQNNLPNPPQTAGGNGNSSYLNYNVTKEDPEEINLSGLASGTCFAFNSMNEHLFLVGTEEGRIHKCSKAYSGQYLETYNGHHMSIYALKWNKFHPRIFLSCSADWTVKLWDHMLPYPLMTFDLRNAVGDIEWSPYSSTTFAAVTTDGKVHVFDLSVNKLEALCTQKVVNRAKPTHIAFNKESPIIIVGDDRGGVNSLKLSPNLRKLHEPRGDDDEILPHDPFEHQVNQMEKLLTAIMN